MRLRKFEILGVERFTEGHAGPEYSFQVAYKAIRNKEWIQGKLWIIARNEKEARNKAESRFSDK